MMLEKRSLSHLELDALKEVGNIGAGHAAIALSQIVDKTIMIGVSQVNIIPIAKIPELLGNNNQKAVAIHLKVLGDVIGGILLLLNWEEALTLVEVLNNNPRPPSTEPLSEMDTSSLKECGSILAAAYLEAIGNFIHMSLIPSVPDLVMGEGKEILRNIFHDLAKRAELAFCIETEFMESVHKIKGNFLLVPEVKSLEIILKGLGLAPAGQTPEAA